jgi:cytochrome c oxidase subunit 2
MVIKPGKWFVSGLLAAALLLTPAVAGKGKGNTEPAKKTNSGHVKKFKVTAVDGDINPQQIKVRRGDRVSITFKSLDGHYRVQFKEFGVKRSLHKGEDVTIEIVATEEGVFPFRCTKAWSVKRWAKNGTIVVK